MTYRVFLDANVLFSAVISARGVPREILYLPDAVVLAAALSSQADFFITGDNEHFLSKPDLEDQANIFILSPRSFLNLLAKE